MLSFFFLHLSFLFRARHNRATLCVQSPVGWLFDSEKANKKKNAHKINREMNENEVPNDETSTRIGDAYVLYVVGRSRVYVLCDINGGAMNAFAVKFALAPSNEQLIIILFITF